MSDWGDPPTWETVPARSDWHPSLGFADESPVRAELETGPGDVAFPEADPTTGYWSGAFVVVHRDLDAPVVAVGDGLAVPATVIIRRGTTTVVVDNTGERPTYTVTICTTSANLLNRLHLRSLVEQSIDHVLVSADARHVSKPSVARRYVRAKVSERDVEQAAEAYRAGGIDEVRRVMHVGVRQAWRYVARAQDKELLPRQRNRKKGT